MKIKYNSSGCVDAKRHLNNACKYLQKACDDVLSHDYPSGFHIPYVDNPLFECRDHKRKLNSIINWLDDSERGITNVIRNVESDLNTIRGCEVRQRGSLIK